MDPELEEEMKKLEGLGTMEETPMTPVKPTVQQTTSQIQPMQPSVAQVAQKQVNNSATTNVAYTTNQPVQPFVPENPTNLGVVTNQVTNTTPAQQPDIMNQMPVFVNLAANTYQTKTNFFSLKENEKSRVTLANVNFIRNHIHWLEGLGKVRCLSTYDENDRWPASRALCCQQVNEKGEIVNAKNRLLVPIVEYPVSKVDGKLIQGQTPTLKVWDMNYVEEKSLRENLNTYCIEQGLSEDDPERYAKLDLSVFDFVVTKTKSGTYSSISLSPVPSWRANPNWNNLVKAEIAKIDKEFYINAYNESARTMSEQAIYNHYLAAQQKNAAAQNLANQQVPNMNDINLGI